MKKNQFIVGVILFMTIFLFSCSNDKNKVLHSTGIEPRIGGFTEGTVDDSYDINQLTSSKSQPKIGYVNNILIIFLSKEFPILFNKKGFNKFIETKTNLAFLNKINNESIDYPYPWEIEFINASEEEMEMLINTLEALEEIRNVRKIQKLLPEFDSLENIQRLRNAKNL